MSQQEKIKFVVKNGRYAGSVIELDQGQEYSLGRSFHCDIAIDDPRFAERQMLLKVGVDGVQIKLLAEGKLSVDGESKDTQAQSEWRNMDPRSAFLMNDLEFSFEASPALFAQFQKEASTASAKAQPEMAGASANAGAPSQSASESPNQRFDEAETQVPGEDRGLEEKDVQIQVMPNLADELDFDTGSDIQYKKSQKNLPVDDQDRQQKKYIVGGAIAAGVLLFLGVYYFMGSGSSSTPSEDVFVEAPFEDQQPDNTDLTPFEFEPVSQGEQQSLTDPQSDDPFAMYDQMQQQEGQPESPIETEEPEKAEVAVVDEQSEVATVAKVEGQSVVEEQAAKVKKEELKSDAELSEDKSDTIYFNQDQGDAEAFGELSENEGDELRQAEPQDSEPEASVKKSMSVSKDDNSLLAVIRGRATASTIVLPATRDLLDGLGLGYLRATIRSPKKGETPPVVVVSGYVDNRREWMRAKEIVEQDVLELGLLVDNVSSPEVRKARLEQWISESNLKGKVQTYLSERGLIAKVNLNPSQEATWKAIAQQYVKKFDNTPALFVMRDPGDWLKIRSISFGDRPYLVTQDGSVLSPGAKLSNGYSIVAIRRSGIELRDQFGSYTYMF